MNKTVALSVVITLAVIALVNRVGFLAPVKEAING
jgi:hypothetical protein